MLSGNLADFSLLDVMQLLLTSGRTGALRLAHPRGGDVWLEGGEVVHATALGRSGEDALSLIASLHDGQFNFDQGATTSDRSVAMRREAVLTRMLQEGDAWAPIIRAMPDWTSPVRFTNGWSDQTRVTRRQYEALSLVGRGDLATMVRASSFSPRELMEILLPFWQAGKLEYGA
ncbi:DUF4388 domain-containing protein [Deinococcus pimensis]|uniref:DUF4388 domain-containing protein n=1 Tax=Deinococcus pimensis TaxID=309888 RepID=UPI0004893783|nr:DUF4388 domain-containing protein [Deinococcus pimensis]